MLNQNFLLAINGLDGIGKGNAVGFSITDLVVKLNSKDHRQISHSDATDATSTCDS